MANFVDQVTDFSYAGGLVNFKLQDSRDGNAPISISMPYSAFEHASTFLFGEVGKVQPIHSEWIKFELNKVSEAPPPSPDTRSKSEALGPKIGTIK